MSIRTDRLKPSFKSFIEAQPMFFVATAAPTGRVNMSPKGLDSLRVLSDQKIVWLSMSGSGNETAAHVLQDPRMTLMFCAFQGDALILRVFGNARVIHPRDADWAQHYGLFPDYAGARNIYVLDIDMVTTSCGTGVPEMSIQRRRAESEMVPWYDDLGEAGVKAFWAKKNTKSLDGFETGIFADPVD
ncbi:MAG: pyridoxamine 5'-phosphate oxidase family protein [Planktotalea sp.]|uniref:pyridoxamine 5'-phosphate oxidase family protein n=1 Tax=Planktotalea sp. TaxID=2029877 RepID=UPI003C73D6A3